MVDYGSKLAFFLFVVVFVPPFSLPKAAGGVILGRREGLCWHSPAVKGRGKIPDTDYSHHPPAAAPKNLCPVSSPAVPHFAPVCLNVDEVVKGCSSAWPGPTCEQCPLLAQTAEAWRFAYPGSGSAGRRFSSG